MSSFDARAREWDKDKMHMDRSLAIAAALEKRIVLEPSMKALEYGAGTGILSFLLKDKLAEITLMDSSAEMIKVCEEKVEYYQTPHIRPLFIDLEHSAYSQTFDLIYNQMVLHHVVDVDSMLARFYTMLNPNGYLAIADLYTEDGSFHGPQVNVHLGFEPDTLATTLSRVGFTEVEHRPCFTIKRPTGAEFPVFLLIARKGNG